MNILLIFEKKRGLFSHTWIESVIIRCYICKTRWIYYLECMVNYIELYNELADGKHFRYGLIREFWQKFIFEMTLLVIHLRHVESLDFFYLCNADGGCWLMVFLPQTPNILFTTFYRFETKCPNCLISNKILWH